MNLADGWVGRALALENSRSLLQLTFACITTQLVLDAGRDLVRKTRFHVFVDALEMLDMAVIARLAKEGDLSVDGRAIREVILAQDAKDCLCQVLTALHRGIILYIVMLVWRITLRAKDTVHRSYRHSWQWRETVDR